MINCFLSVWKFWSTNRSIFCGTWRKSPRVLLKYLWDSTKINDRLPRLCSDKVSFKMKENVQNSTYAEKLCQCELRREEERSFTWNREKRGFETKGRNWRVKKKNKKLPNCRFSNKSPSIRPCGTEGTILLVKARGMRNYFFSEAIYGWLKKN